MAKRETKQISTLGTEVDDHHNGFSQEKKDYAALYQAYIRSVYRYLFSRVRNVKDAEDLTAQVFLEALEGLPSFRYGYFPSWLFGIARRKTADYFRKRWPEVTIEDVDDFPGSARDPLRDVIQSEDILRLGEQINQLKEADKELLRLRFVAELSFPQIGSVLDKNPEAVKKQVYRLLDRLKNQLERDHD
jgi:RNA polymerase sigma-70 factor (ECF subfamily)